MTLAPVGVGSPRKTAHDLDVNSLPMLDPPDEVGHAILGVGGDERRTSLWGGGPLRGMENYADGTGRWRLTYGVAPITRTDGVRWRNARGSEGAAALFDTNCASGAKEP